MQHTSSVRNGRDESAAADDPVPAGETVLQVRNLRKTYGDDEGAVTAVDDVSFAVDRGEVVGVLGPNGAGKTTTIKCILGLVVPTAGSVEIHGVDIQEHPCEVYRHVAAMLEGARNVYWRLTVRENVAFFAALGGQFGDDVHERQDRLLEQFGLTDMADETVNELSRGQKQRVSLACTLARGTDVVFLDEPTLGLDVEASLELRGELRRLADEEDITVVLSSHDMDVVEAVCDRVVILSEGRVIADDSVRDLVDLFETRAYRLEVAAPVPGDVRRTLAAEFDATDWDAVGDRTRFGVTLTDGDSLYDVLAVLEGADLPLTDIDGQDPDLEEVFLEVTGRRPDRESVGTSWDSVGMDGNAREDTELPGEVDR